jgi:hypothetical protein
VLEQEHLDKEILEELHHLEFIIGVLEVVEVLAPLVVSVSQLRVETVVLD